MSAADIFLALIAVLFPPIAVWIKRGLCSVDSLLNILLCLLGYLPGLLHAWYIIAKFPDASEYAPLAQDAEHGDGRVTYYYVNGNGQQRQGRTGEREGYGTTAAPRLEEGGQGINQGPSNGAVPPSYDDAVKGNHKVQT